MYQYALLTPATAVPFQRLLSPPSRHLLAQLEPDQLVAVGAWCMGRPAGIALASQGRPAFLQWLYVAPAYRRVGVGSRLLTELEAHLVARDAEQLALLYDREAGDGPALERLLAARGWSEPVCSRRMVWFSEESIQGCPWLERAWVPAEFTVTPWAEVSDAELAAIARRQAEGPWFPPSLSPFSIPRALMAPFACLALRRGGEIVGWGLSRMVSPDTLIYEILFLTPEVRGGQAGLGLAAEMVRRSLGRGIPFAGWGTNPDNSLMLSFVERLLAPYAIRRNDEWETQIALAPAPAIA